MHFFLSQLSSTVEDSPKTQSKQALPPQKKVWLDVFCNWKAEKIAQDLAYWNPRLEKFPALFSATKILLTF